MLVSEMIEYLNFIPICTLVALLGAATCYPYYLMKTLLKIADESLTDLLPEVPYDSPKSDEKRQKLNECVLTRISKQYLSKAYTEEWIKELNKEQVNKIFSNYKAKPSGQMVKSLGKSIIKMYSVGACTVLRMTNQDVLSKDLESDPFLNSALQRLIVNCTTNSVHYLHH